MKRLLTVLLTLGIITYILQPSIVYAQQRQTRVVTGSSIDISLESSFEVSETDIILLGGGVMVDLPVSLNSTYNKKARAFTCSDVVTITGDIGDSHKVCMSTDNSVVYNNRENPDASVCGEVIFGEDGYAEWVQEDINNHKTECIEIRIPMEEITEAGTYDAVLDFFIWVDPI